MTHEPRCHESMQTSPFLQAFPYDRELWTQHSLCHPRSDSSFSCWRGSTHRHRAHQLPLSSIEIMESLWEVSARGHPKYWWGVLGSPWDWVGAFSRVVRHGKAGGIWILSQRLPSALWSGKSNFTPLSAYRSGKEWDPKSMNVSRKTCPGQTHLVQHSIQNSK